MATLPLVSCFDDDSTLGTKEIGDITVTGIAESYTATAYVGEHLQITPEVDAGYEENDMSYTWTLLDSNTGSTDDDGNMIEPTVISTDKNLDWEVATKPGTYQIRFIAEAKSNGYKSYTATKLTVQTDFTQGFYVMKEISDGNTDIDLLAYNGTFAEDLIAQTSGESLKGKPLSLSAIYNTWYIDPDTDEMEGANAIAVVTDDGELCIKRTADMQTIFTKDNLLYGEMPSDEKPYTFINSMGGFSGAVNYCSSNGIRSAGMSGGTYSSASTGQFGLPIEEVGTSRFVVHDPTSYGGLAYWNETTHSLMIADYSGYSSPLTYDDFTGEELTQNLETYNCLHMGYNMMNGAGTATAVLEDNATSQRYLCTVGFGWMGSYLSNYWKVNSNLHLSKATAFCTNGNTAKYIYCVDGGKVYACVYSNDELSEVQLTFNGIAEGETITYVGNQYWSGYFSDGTEFDYLLVGTQSGNSYSVYMYNMVGGVPDGAPVKTLHGSGLLKAVRYMSPKFDTYDWNFGYNVFNSND